MSGILRGRRLTVVAVVAFVVVAGMAAAFAQPRAGGFRGFAGGA